MFPLIFWGQHFDYPVPPDSIIGRQDRINYMTSHFWTEKTVSDMSNFQTPKLMLDYLYLLRQTNEQKKSAQSFVAMACKQENTFGQILYWLDNILYDSSSPHYDETLYLLLMNEVLSSNADSVMKIIPQQRVEVLRNNQLGRHANDFSFVNKDGNTNSLYTIEAPLLLLLFNNPDCSLCHQTEENIDKNEKLQTLLNKGWLKILAITPYADYDEWMQHIYPSNWLIGIDKEEVIYNQQLYDIQHLPCIYLLGKDKRVLLKEADYERLCKFLSENDSLFDLCNY